MSNAIFPTLPGLSWGSTREPIWVTSAKKSLSGMEQRAGYMSYPLYRIKLSYEFLRAGSDAELQTLIGFFNQRGGDLESFLFLDPDDSEVVEEQFGTGDGTTTAFRLGRTVGGFFEPVDAVLDPSVGDPYANMLPYSEELERTIWGQSADANVDVLPNAIACPTGAVVAEKLYEVTTATSAHRLLRNYTQATDTDYCLSIYAKAGERNLLELMANTSAVTYPIGIFDLSSGALSGAPSAGASAGIEAAGNGWFRCWIAFNSLDGLPAASNAVYITMLDAAGVSSYAGTPGNGLYLWGAQLERGTNPSQYMPATVIEQTSNYLLYSDQIDNAAWTKVGSTTVTANAVSGPTSAQTAELITSLKDEGVSQSTSLPAGSRVFLSVFIRAGTATSIRLRDQSGAGRHIDYNPSTGLVTAASNVLDYGVGPIIATQWRRIWMTYVTDSASQIITIRPNDAGSTTFYLAAVQLDKSNVLGQVVTTTSAIKAAADYSIDPMTATVTFTTAPASGLPLVWSGRFYKRVRFEKGTAEFRQFLTDLWEAKTLSLMTVKT